MSIIENLSTKTWEALEQWENDIKTALINFLTTNYKRCVVFETSDSIVGMLRVKQVLQQLHHNDQGIPSIYITLKNQMYLIWEELLDILKSSEEVPKFKNLCVCGFLNLKNMEQTDKGLIRETIENLTIKTTRKFIFITSETGLLKGFLENLEKRAFLKIDEVNRKVTSSMYADESEDLIKCAQSGRVNNVIELLKHGVNVNSSWGESRSTALHMAAEQGYVDVVLTLLYNKANILPDNLNRSPLHIAVKNGHKNVVSLLLENNSNIDMRDNSEQTALHYAAAGGYVEIVLMLLRKGASILPDCNEDTALHLAAKYGQLQVVVVLLENDIDVNIKGSKRCTALHKAAFKGHDEVIKILLKYGADIDAQNISGYTALHNAVRNNKEAVVHTLLNYGTNIDIQNSNGDTPLHCAALRGNSEIVEVLKNKGARTDIKNHVGKTPFDTAAHYNRNNVVKMLLPDTNKGGQ